MTSPSTNQPSTSAPKAKSVSPNIRIQRRRVSMGVCRNSAERAYQVPYSTEAQACISPMGSMLSRTIARQSDVDRPERDRQRAVLPHQPRAQRPQAEQHQPDAQHAVDAEQRGVPVHGRQVQSLHVVERDRRIDHEAEQAGAHEVPERHGDEEVDRPLVGADPWIVGSAAREADILPGFEADQHERHDFEGAEHGPQGQHRR